MTFKEFKSIVNGCTAHDDSPVVVAVCHKFMEVKRLKVMLKGNRVFVIGVED